MSDNQNTGGTHRPQPVPVPLSKPIKAHGRDVSELTLRPLTGKVFGPLVTAATY